MKRAVAWAALGAVVVALIGGGVYLEWFAPEASTSANEPFPTALLDGSGNTSSGTSPVPLRTGSFQGADDFHYARGTVALYQAANGSFVLRFDDYDAREGPDVYLYLTRTAGDDSTSAVEGQGLRLRVPGGEGDGRATVRGSFNLVLPREIDPLGYGGITIWCADFNHFFGHAALASP